MRRIFVYEFLSAGGSGGDIAAALRPVGAAMRDAIVGDLLQLPDVAVTVAVDGDAPTIAAAASPALRIVQPRRGEPAREFVRRQAAVHELAWVVAPESGGVLAEMQAAVGPACWIGCSAAAIATASSKRATLRALAAAGIATPLDAADDGGRWVVKPDDGAGTVDTRRHPSRAAAQADNATRRRAGLPATLEPWVEGEALSVVMLVDTTGAETLVFNRQRIALDAEGWLRDDGVDLDALRREGDPRLSRLAALAARVPAAIGGLFGVVGLDLVWHPRRGPVAIEINPRVTSAYVGLSARLGRNVAGEVLRRHAACTGRLEPAHA
jgi:predicted ATP-grasp superfamily ATP-dependent carboligase